MNDAESMKTAAQLIRAGKLAAARALLLDVQEPEHRAKAREWIGKIDAMMPAAMPQQATAPEPAYPPQGAAQAKRATKRGLRPIQRVVLVVGVAFVVFLIIAAINGAAISNAAIEDARIWARLLSWCNYVYVGTDFIDFCDDWPDIYRDSRAVITCHRMYPDLDNPFRQCVAGEGIRP